uniref:Folylpolyglutamate synthase n=1 Tax=Culicoides sonorensis TaxID=179676 RepID=A0A336KWZ9_CULSO
MLLYRIICRRRFCSRDLNIIFNHNLNDIKMGFDAMDCVTKRYHSSKVSRKPEVTTNDSYEKAITVLNNLLPNSAFLQNAITQQRSNESLNLEDTVKYLNRAGMTLKDLENLKFIHISGTKGKGSTCALVESILRNHGLRTGFYSSPHLISVTERIRLCGLPISKESFAKYFWTVYGKLKASALHDTDYPPYFKFLTIMCFYVFLYENIDVAIMEVGIGGQYDCTNIIPKTKTVGITSLGLEHTQILGNTIEEIAWQKAGIIKNQSDVFTVKQPNGCIDVIKRRAQEKSAKLFVVPDYDDYLWTREPNVESLKDIKAQQLNTSLAIQLAMNWMHHNLEIGMGNGNILQEDYKIVTKIPEKVVQGIEKCFWPGRCQLLQYQSMNFYLDGAHTSESIQVCSDWFMKCTKDNKPFNKRILIFNMTGPRQTSVMLKLLMDKIKFDFVFFVPNIASISNSSPDMIATDDQLERCKENERTWKELAENQNGRTKSTLIKVLPSILDALNYLEDNLLRIERKIDEKDIEIDILVTGSLHLVGACLMGLEEFDKIKS